MDEPSPVLIVLHDKDDAAALAEELLGDGWAPCTVHKELLAGEDDAEDADWVVLLETAPDGLSASCWQDELERLAEGRDGFVTDAS